MAKFKVIKNGVEVEIDDKDLDRQPETPRSKSIGLGRKDRILLKLIASLTGTTYIGLLAQIQSLAIQEPDDTGPY